MRILASYALTSTVSGSAERNHLYGTVSDAIETWLRSKGALSKDSDQLLLATGGVADITRRELKLIAGHLFELELAQDAANGRFRTTVALGQTPDTLAVFVQMSLVADALVPQRLDVRCPKVVRDVLALPGGWSYRDFALIAQPLTCRGKDEADMLVDRLWDVERAIPMILVSEESGLVLHPQICEAMAADTAGLAVVVRVDDEASWRVTTRKGKEWSCYNGAIRIYWPDLSRESRPLDHPTWTPRRLLAGGISTGIASRSFRDQLRRLVLAQSAFAVIEPEVLGTLRRAARDEQWRARLDRVTSDSNDYLELADEYREEADRLSALLATRDEEIRDLRRQNANLLLSLESIGEPTDIEPDSESEPQTVEDAVVVARTRFDNTLIFGNDVADGVQGLARDAGPPHKISDYLAALDEMTLGRRSGTLTGSVVSWLNDRGINCSRESESTRRSPAKMRKRTWSDGTEDRREFEYHLKPNDGTSPDRCVRIYFEYDDKREKTVVGWVGRHP